MVRASLPATTADQKAHGKADERGDDHGHNRHATCDRWVLRSKEIGAHALIGIWQTKVFPSHLGLGENHIVFPNLKLATAIAAVCHDADPRIVRWHPIEGELR